MPAADTKERIKTVRQYYGIFKQILDVFGETVQDMDLYDGAFAQFYDSLPAEDAEVALYLNEAASCGSSVLELCCGNGRMTTIFARHRFRITGVDASADMLQILEKRKNTLPAAVAARIEIKECDIFHMDLQKKFDFIFLPATTLCILSDNEEQVKALFNRVAHMLEDHGSFMFDLRVYDAMGTGQAECPLQAVVQESAGCKRLVIYQELIQYVEERARANFFLLEKRPESAPVLYLSESNKRILHDDAVRELVRSTSLYIAKTDDVNNGGDSIRYYTLKKKQHHMRVPERTDAGDENPIIQSENKGGENDDGSDECQRVWY